MTLDAPRTFVIAPPSRGTSVHQDLLDVARFFGLEGERTGELMVRLTRTSAKTIDRALKEERVEYRPHLHVVAEFVREARTYLFQVRDWADWTAQDARDMRAWLDGGTIVVDGRSYSPFEMLTDESLARRALSELSSVTE